MVSAPTLQPKVCSMKNKIYNQLTQESRYHISGLRKAGLTIREIAKDVGVHYSTVSRELLRNTQGTDYLPEKAQELSQKRRKKALKASKRSAIVDKIIKDGLVLGWSPGAINARMKLEKTEEETLSHTTIYRRIKEDKLAGGNLFKQLVRYGKSRWKGGKRKRSNAGVKLIPNRVDISKRPEIVEVRGRLGDWEGDTVHGVNGYFVTLVDRLSRFTLVKRVKTKTKNEVAEAMIELFKKVHSAITVTLDNGGEFAGHDQVHKAINIDVFFAKPHASWQRGTNENTNGRLRRLWPKKFDISTLSEEEIEREILCLNLTPRKVLGGLTPLEVFTGRSVALIT